MLFDSWHKDSFLPLPPENTQQYTNWICLLAVVVLICTVAGVVLKKRKF